MSGVRNRVFKSGHYPILVNQTEKTCFVRDLATEQGFDRVGIAPAERVERADYLRQWLAAGMSGEMEYLHRYFDKRVEPAKLLEGARSVIVVALNYYQDSPPPPTDGPHGRVARYAWGDDYHEVLKKKLWGMADRMREAITEPFDIKPCVDTTPILEREFAMSAGIGWIGKNTMVLHQQLGSYFFLGELVTTLELDYDEPATDHCGSCTRCLDACPTAAFPEAYQMDARRCISYHTIELRGDIPEEFNKSIGDWVFGCDICQEVCPFNHSPPQTTEPQFAIRSPGPHPPLRDILNWQVADYRRTLKGSAMKRARLDMLQRNARIALSNTEDGPS